jgi:hypothetical protein
MLIAAVTLCDMPAFAQQRATTRPNNLFTASGFEVRVADTPSKAAQLKKLPPNKLVTRERDGKTFYVYGDPDGCNCAYVGTPEAYRLYQSGGRSSSSASGGNDADPTRLRNRPMGADMVLDRYVNDPGAPDFNRFLFGR